MWPTLKSDHRQLSEPDVESLRNDSLVAPRSRVPWRAVNLLIGFGGVAGAGLLAVLNAPAAGPMIVAAAILGIALLALSVAQHECAHGTLFANRRVNALVGWLAGLLVLTPFAGFRRGHRAHHAWSGRAKDPTPAPDRPRRPSIARDVVLALRIIPVMFVTGVWWPYFIYDWCPTAHRPALRNRLAWLLDAALIVGMHAALGLLIGPVAWLIVAGGGVLLWAILYEQLFTQYHHVGLAPVDHPGIRLPLHEQLHHARSIEMPTWLAGPLLNFNLHKEHHLFPQMPWHRLSVVHTLLRERQPDLLARTESRLRPLRWRHRRSHILLSPTPDDTWR